jgi:serine/threonine protein kinase
MLVAGCDTILHVAALCCRQLSEDKARWLFQQLIFAVDYCHRKGAWWVGVALPSKNQKICCVLPTMLSGNKRLLP